MFFVFFFNLLFWNRNVDIAVGSVAAWGHPKIVDTQSFNHRTGFLNTACRHIYFTTRLLLKQSCLPAIVAAAAKLLQSCLTLCDPIDGPPGFAIPGILQARKLEWIDFSFSNRDNNWNLFQNNYLLHFYRILLIISIFALSLIVSLPYITWLFIQQTLLEYILSLSLNEDVDQSKEVLAWHLCFLSVS